MAEGTTTGQPQGTSIDFFCGVIALLAKLHKDRSLIEGDPAAKSFSDRINLLSDIEAAYKALPLTTKRPRRKRNG